jgi:hypothetical protein
MVVVAAADLIKMERLVVLVVAVGKKILQDQHNLAVQEIHHHIPRPKVILAVLVLATLTILIMPVVAAELEQEVHLLQEH